MLLEVEIPAGPWKIGLGSQRGGSRCGGGNQPHGPLLPNAIGIWAIGTLRRFRPVSAPDVALTVENDLELFSALLDEDKP